MSPALLLFLPALGAEPLDLNDAQPLPGYLEVAAVQPVFEGALGPLAACFAPDVPAAATLTVDVTSDGSVSHSAVVLEAGGDAPRTCVHTQLCSLAFDPHDEPTSRWEARVAHRQGQVFLLPSLRLIPRPRLPLFTRLPDDGSFEGLDQLLGPAWPLTPLEALPACAEEAAPTGFPPPPPQPPQQQPDL